MVRRRSNSGLITRRAALAGAAAAAAYGAARASSAIAEPANGPAAVETSAGPVFSATGPDAERYGAAEGFPVPGSLRARLQGNPYKLKYRVGAFSHFDEIYPTRQIARAATPWTFTRSAVHLRYTYAGSTSSLTEYLSRNPVTGLLIARDEQILFEHYQYGRTDRDRLISQSMVKSIMGILIGIAISEGAIKTVDDTPDMYVPEFKDSQYGRTPIRDLLHMSSGVDFGEERNGGRDLNRLWSDMIAGSWIGNKGTINSIVQFNRRIAPPGTRFYYASIEPDVLGVVLHYAVGKSPPIICMKNFGSRSAPRPMRIGFWMRKDSRWRISASTLCCATTRELAACWPMTARGKAGNSFRRNG